MKNRLKIVSLLTLVCLTSGLCLSGCSKTESAVADTKTTNVLDMKPTFKDVVYGDVKNDNGDDRQLKMNIFKPENATEATPVLVYVHGGGWVRGDYECDDREGYVLPTVNSAGQPVDPSKEPESAYQTFKKVLNSGITFVSVDYRLNNEAKLPAQIFDVKASIRHLRAHAEEYGINPDKIAIAGNSAGGHLASLLATTSDVPELEGDIGGNTEYSSKVMALVDYYAPTDLLTMGPDMNTNLQTPEQAALTHDSVLANESILLGFTGEGQGIGTLRAIRDNNDTTSPYWEKLKLAELCSPVNNVTSDDPAVFIAHGESDALVSVQQGIKFRDALNKAGVENVFMSSSTAPHGYQGEIVNHAAIDWITNKLLEN